MARVAAVLVLVVLVASQTDAVTDRLAGLTKPEEFLDICMDGRNHKTKPGPEDQLASMCSPWKQKSCCTAENSQQMHISDSWLNFDWNHCNTLSPDCRSHFLQDLCFYECSPNVAPWIVEDVRKIRNEKFQNVPLCASVCNNWFEDCKNDLTCLVNWSKGFNWTTGINTCPTDSQCQTFEVVYGNASNFCEQVWGGSWRVVPDTEPCMVMWFDHTRENPNTAIALDEARRLLGIGAASSLQPGSACLLVALLLACLLALWQP